MLEEIVVIISDVIILKVGEQAISSRVERTKKFWTFALLKVHCCGPLHLHLPALGLLLLCGPPIRGVQGWSVSALSGKMGKFGENLFLSVLSYGVQYDLTQTRHNFQ